MTIQLFDSIAFEVYISAAWVDITGDVQKDPAPSWNMGIMGNGSLDRVGDPEYITFSLNNSESSSGGLVGYYTPGHTNCRTGWATGIPMRLVFVFEGVTRYKFYGLIAPDGIMTEPGIYGPRQVRVQVEGFMSIASRHILELLSLQTNLTIEEAVPFILANMPIQPLKTSYGSGVDTFPTIFDTLSSNTSAAAEFMKLALSEFGYIYTRGDNMGGQTLVVEGRSDRTNVTNTLIPVPNADSGFLLKEDGSYLLKEDGGKIILDEAQTINFDNIALPGMRTSYGRNLSNRIAGASYPRQIDAAATTVLFSLQKRILVNSGQTVSNIRGRYRDPNGAATYVNGKDMVTPVSGTDFNAYANEDGTGTNYTANMIVTAVYGTEQVDYTIQNTGGASFYAWVQARGRGIYRYDPAIKLFEDATSKNIYGLFPLNLDMPYQDDPLALDSVGNLLLSKDKDPHTTVDAYPLLANRDADNMYAFLWLEPGTREHFSETVTGTDDNYFIQGYSAQLIKGKYVIWSPILKMADDTSYWVLDISDLDTGTILDT